MIGTTANMTERIHWHYSCLQSIDINLIIKPYK